MWELAAQGVKFLTPPLWMTVTAKDGAIVPSRYAEAAKQARRKMIGWSLERFGRLKDGGGYDYQSVHPLIAATATRSPCSTRWRGGWRDQGVLRLARDPQLPTPTA